MLISQILILVFLSFALCSLINILLTKEYSYVGSKQFRKMQKEAREKEDLWSVFGLKQLLEICSKYAYVDAESEVVLKKKLNRAGLDVTAKEYMGKLYAIFILATVLLFIFLLMQFYFGVIVTVLGAVFFMLKSKEELNSKIQTKDLAINNEMPKLVRTICRNLQTDRDLFRVLKSYRKVAGKELGDELDILLLEMETGNVQNALTHFETRIGSVGVGRLCMALKENFKIKQVARQLLFC